MIVILDKSSLSKLELQETILVFLKQKLTFISSCGCFVDFELSFHKLEHIFLEITILLNKYEVRIKEDHSTQECYEQKG